MLEDILIDINKPARYIGREWNSSDKDFKQAKIKFALCFPDLYEVGMSNLGLRILYGILNGISDVCCERLFAPGLDLENKLRSEKKEISTIESSKKLKEFDILGFSLGYELCYTNVLNILDLGGIPLEASNRGSEFPLVIAGGPCVFNPEPMHEFFDLFIIGEAEEAITELIEIYRKARDDFKSSVLKKSDLLLLFSGIEGVYVPSFYAAQYDESGKIREFCPRHKNIPSIVRKRLIRDLDKAYFPTKWLVPFIQIVHDRITLEVTRGCPNSCRFCQARQQYFPFRQKSPQNLFNLAQESYKNTGYEEIALGGLSVSDYPHIEELLKMLIASFKDKGVSISLPSIKPKQMIGNLSSLIASIKKTGLTFAPEAGSGKMRNILGKDFDTDDFFKVMSQAFASGYQHVKLYFMIGLPHEEYRDLDAIDDFSFQVSELRRKTSRYPAQVNLSVNTLIPKPHTPFQWFKMLSIDEIEDRQNYLKNKILRHKKLRVNFHNRYMSFLEGVFSRGDRRLSKVVVSAFNKGARFDAWDEHFDFNKWQEAFSECGVDPGSYLVEKSVDDKLAWDFLDLGVNKELLVREFNKAVDIK